MEFEQNLFISYAHIDNQPVHGERGWITQFHETLEALLSIAGQRRPISGRD